MNRYEVMLSFRAVIQVEAEDQGEAIEQAIEKARADYGSEVADYGAFELIEEGEGNDNTINL